MWKVLILNLGAFQCAGMTALLDLYFIITIICMFNVVSCITVLFRATCKTLHCLSHDDVILAIFCIKLVFLIFLVFYAD